MQALAIYKTYTFLSCLRKYQIQIKVMKLNDFLILWRYIKPVQLAPDEP